MTANHCHMHQGTGRHDTNKLAHSKIILNTHEGTPYVQFLIRSLRKTLIKSAYMWRWLQKDKDFGILE